MFYLIDVGSSTIKIYQRKEGEVLVLKTKTFNFKDGFSSKIGLSSEKKEALFSWFRELIAEYGLNRSNTKIFATGIFRDIPDKRAFIWDFYIQTQLLFNIISHFKKYVN